MINSTHHFFESLAQAARSDRLLLFVGAGVSVGYGLPSWQELATLISNDSANELSPPDVFEQYIEANGLLAFHEFLERKLGRRPATILPLTQLLLEIRSLAIITTNADRILETVAQQLGAPIRTFINDSDLEDFHTTPWLRLIKLHGSLDQKDSLVFSRKQYEQTPTRVPALRSKVMELIRYCKTVFVGFSMADPDFLDLIHLVSMAKPGNLNQMVGLFPEREIRDGWRKLHLDDKVRSHFPLLEVPIESFDADLQRGTEKFLNLLRDRISPSELPTLSEQCIVFAHGHTATLKSEVTAYLANCLGIPLLATHQYGRCTKDGLLDEKLRHSRYERMLNDAEALIRGGTSIILDGTFADLHWRNRIYHLAAQQNIKVIVLTCRCEDEAYIRVRLWRRRLDHTRSEHEVVKIENYYVTREAVEAHPLEADVLPDHVLRNVITFTNNGDRSVRLNETAGEDAHLLASLIQISHLMSLHI